MGLIRKIKNFFYRINHPARIVSPNDFEKNKDNAWSISYRKGKVKNHGREHSKEEVKKLGLLDEKGRRIKIWRQVKQCDNPFNDLFVPIYFLRKKKSPYQWRRNDNVPRWARDVLFKHVGNKGARSVTTKGKHYEYKVVMKEDWQNSKWDFDFYSRKLRRKNGR